MMSRSGRYGTQDGTSTRDERVENMKYQLREHILNMSDSPVLSFAWFEMAESVIQVGQVAAVESVAPIQVEKNVVDQVGRSSLGTLWDQHKDEIAVRTMLEEGKLNLSMRLLQRYTEVAMKRDVFRAEIKEFADVEHLAETSVMQTCRKFEQFLGMLLHTALCHVEALQILDIPFLVQHCRDIILFELQTVEPDITLLPPISGMQRTMVVYYLQSLTEHMEQLDEERIMETLDVDGILSILAQYALKEHKTRFSTADSRQVVCIFGNIFRSEQFITESDRYASNDLMTLLVELKTVVIDPVMALEPDAKLKRNCQKLLDKIGHFARKKR